MSPGVRSRTAPDHPAVSTKITHTIHAWRRSTMVRWPAPAGTDHRAREHPREGFSRTPQRHTLDVLRAAAGLGPKPPLTSMPRLGELFAPAQHSPGSPM